MSTFPGGSVRLDRLLRSSGIALIIVAVLANEWILAAILTGDGRIDPPGKLIYIRLVELYLGLLGTLLLARRPVVRRVLSVVTFAATIVFGAEFAATVAYRLTLGAWHFNQPEPFTMFEPHPYLVGAPIPGISRTENGVTISHNSLGMRGAELAPELSEDGIRIVTIGGSSTYNTGVSDGDTWQEHLGRLLGPEYEVLNLGVPGYSTAEHVIQTALHLSDLLPDLAIYYVGWNDVRSAHVADLKADYSSFHGRGQYTNLGLPLRVWQGPNLAFPAILIQGGQGLRWVNDFAEWRPASAGTISDEVDERAISLFTRNVTLMITLARAQGVQPVLVPQILNYARWSSDEPVWWIPFVRQRDVKSLMAAYNAQLELIASEMSVPFVSEVLMESWSEEDFIDEGHFSSRGQNRFAQAIAPTITDLTSR